MGGNPDREPPFFFYEFELVAAIGKGGANIRPEAALTHVYGYAAGLDMTRRDLQDQAKKMARPWDAAKAFDHSAPCSRIVPASRIGNPTAAEPGFGSNATAGTCRVPISRR